MLWWGRRSPHRPPCASARRGSEPVQQAAQIVQFDLRAFAIPAAAADFIEKLAGPEAFEVEALDYATFDAPRPREVLAFQKKVAELHRAVQGSLRVSSEAQTRIRYLRKAVIDTPGADLEMLRELDAIETALDDLLVELRGDRVRASRGLPTAESISSRVSNTLTNLWLVTSDPTGTEREQYGFAADAFERVLGELRSLLEGDLREIENDLEALGAPWTPGRLPNWKR